jgi:hypothetical protein
LAERFADNCSSGGLLALVVGSRNSSSLFTMLLNGPESMPLTSADDGDAVLRQPISTGI